MTNTTNIRDEDLILYITSKIKDAKGNGAILLNKVLYYSDNLHYIEYGRPISNFKYVHRDFGPTPHPHQFLPLRTSLIRAGKLREENFENNILNRNRKKLVALKPHTKGVLSNEELKLIDKVIAELHDYSAEEVSDLSHDELGWQLTKNGDEIPFHAFALSVPELDDEDYTWVDDELKKLEKDCA